MEFFPLSHTTCVNAYELPATTHLREAKQGQQDLHVSSPFTPGIVIVSSEHVDKPHRRMAPLCTSVLKHRSLTFPNPPL